MQKYGLFFVLAALLMMRVMVANAEIPRLITYQGRLTDAAGSTAPDDSYTVNFIIYDDSTSGSQLWSETHIVETVDGLFDVQLGLHTSLDEQLFIDHPDLFMALQISSSPEMTPRIRMTSSAFSYQAFHADHADIALAATTGGGWADDGMSVRLDNPADNVGIGTSTPTAKLDVEGDAVIRGKTTLGTSQTNTGDKASISGGNANTASGDGAVIGGGDSNTADSLLTTIGGGQGNYASGTGTTIGGGVANQAFALFSTISGGGPSDFDDILNTNNKAYDRFGTIGGGSGNRVGINDGNPESATHATIGGGYNNWAASTGSSIGGGRENFVEGDYATVAGGGGLTESDGNYARGDWATISGGLANMANGSSATVGGGSTNRAMEQGATVGGGATNRADSGYSTIGGGAVNSAQGHSATVSGGSHNSATAQYATVSGGYRDIASGEAAFVGGGQYCYARANHSVVAGGGGYAESDSNSAQGDWSVISGGGHNLAEGHGSVIGGGAANQSAGQYSAITGGTSNIAVGDGSVVGGGKFNRAWGDYSVVSGGGGFYDSDSNSAKGEGATIPGGRANVADGDFSFAAGFRAKALHEGTFVWADRSVPLDFQSTGANKFLIRASGGVGIGTVSPGAMLDVADDDRALRLRAGNGQAEFTDNQILLSYNGTVNYTHAIKTRHSGSNNARNAIDFFVWDMATDAVTEVGSKHVMTIDGEGVGEVGIGTDDPQHTLDVRGEIGNNGIVYHSDRRWKTSIIPLYNALEKVQQLRGVSYEWRRDEFPEMNFSEGRHVGLIAQEVDSVLPELVVTDSNGYESVAYANLVAVLIEAVKEQQSQIVNQQEQIQRLTAEVEKLKSASAMSMK